MQAARTQIGYAASGCLEWCPPLPYQREVLATQARVIVLQWGRGTGKTTTLWTKLVLLSLKYPGMRWLALAPAYRVLSDALVPVIEMWDATYRELYGHSLIRKWARSQSINVLRFVNGTTVTFRTAANINSTRGGSYGGLYLEEAGYIAADPYSWASFIPSIRGYGPHAILAGGTPDGDDGILGILIDQASRDPDIYISRACTMDNPFFPAHQLALMRATMSPEMWAQEVEGRVIKRSGLVYPEFDRATHIVDWDFRQELRKPGWESYVVIDWGYAQAHALFLAARQLDDTKPPELVVYRDLPFERADAETICRQIIAAWGEQPIPVRAIVTDPEGFAENRTARKLFAPYGRSVIFEKDPQKRRIEKTVEYVRRLLKAADGTISLRVTRDVANLDCNKPGGRGVVVSLESYRLSEVRQGSGVYKNKPVDDNKHTHVLDALRYWPICMHRFGYSWPWKQEIQGPMLDRKVNQWS